MSTTIQIKRSSTASAVPLAGDLAVGELAVNLADKRLFAKQADGTIIELSTNPTDLDAATLRIDGVEITASATELNSLDGLTATTAELNILDGVTATATEINVLDGITSTTTELNKLDGFTGSTAELNLLDGLTASTTELNYVDGVTSSIQTQLDNKADDTTSPTLTLDGDVSGSATLTNLGDATLTVTVADDSHNHIVANVDGLQTALDGKATSAQGALADSAVQPNDNVSFGTGSFSGEIAANGGIALGDNDKATFGASDDLEIYCDGTNSIIKETSGGSLYVGGGDIHLMNPTFSEYYISAIENGSVNLRYDNSLKLATTATGVDVTGTVTADGLTVDGASQLNTTGLANGLTITGNDNNNVKIRFDNIGTGGGDFVIQSGIQGASNQGLSIRDLDNSAQRLYIGSGGDVSFFEDTGTTAKFVWDASAESLSIGGSTLGKFNVSDGSNPLVVDSATYNEIQSYNRPLLLNRQGNNVGIGTDSPRGTLSLGSAATGQVVDKSIHFGYTTTNNYGWKIEHSQNPSAVAAGDFKFVRGTTASWAESARFDNNGNLLVGTTSLPTGTTTGVGVNPSGLLIATRNGTTGGSPAIFNRTASDGEIVGLWKDGSTVGSIGANNTDLYIANDTAGIKFFDNHIRPVVSSGGTYDNAIDLGVSSGRFKDLYLSGGVYLGGTGAANKLDDYEEGTWTPTVNSGTVSINNAIYTKVGRIIHISADIALSGARTSSQFIIGGLPFRVASGVWAGGQAYAQDLVVEFDKFLFVPRASSDRFTGVIQTIDTNGDGGTAVGTDFGNGYLNISATYTTDE